MKKTKKALASLAIVGMVLTMLPINAFASTTAATRYAGVNRYETAAKIADQVGSANKVAVLTAGMDANLVDALAAAPFAASQKAPILMTAGDQLDSYAKAELSKLGVTKVYITTGSTVISKAVTDQLAAMGITFEFVGGANRYETALNLAKKLSAPTGVVVASANDASMVDSLAVASIAAANNMAIVLTDKDSVPADVQAYVKGLNVPTYVIGSSAVVSDSVTTALGATRVGGANRYATNVAVMNQFKGVENFDTAYVASGNDAHLVDALAGAPLAAQTKSPIVLADGAVSSEVSAFAGTVQINNVVAFGSADVVPQGVVDGVKTPAPATLAVQSVSAINAITLQVVYNNPVNELSAETPSNYSINGVALNVAPYVGTTAVLQDDKKTVLLTLPTTAKLTSGTTFLAAVSGVMGTDLVPLAKTYSTAVSFSDTTAPTLGAVSYTNNNTAKVSFSEPMQAIVAGQVKVYDSTGADVTAANLGSAAGVAVGTQDLLIDLTGATVNASYTVKVYGAMDLSNNPAGTLTFNVTKTNADVTAPTVSSVVATGLDTLKITYSEKVATDVAASTNGYGDLTVAGSSYKMLTGAAGVTSATVDTAGTTLTVVLATPVTAGLNAVSVNNFLDASQNKQTTAYNKVIDFEADTTAPKVLSTSVATVNGVDELLVKFDDSNIALVAGSPVAVAAGTYVNNNIQYASSAFGVASLYDPAGAGTTDTVAIPLTGLTSGVYSVSLNGVAKDQTGNVNASSAISFSYNATSASKPAVLDDVTGPSNGISSGFTAQTIASPNTIELTFNKDVTPATALNVNNYLVDGVAAFKSAVFDADQHHVLLTLNQGAIKATATYSFSISNVADAAGNVMNPITFVQGFTENVAPTLASATLTSPSAITLKFSEPITAITSDKTAADLNFTVKSGSNTMTLLTTGTVVQGADTKTWIINLANPLSAAQVAAGLTVTVNTTNTILDASAIKNAFGSTAVTVNVQ